MEAMFCIPATLKSENSKHRRVLHIEYTCRISQRLAKSRAGYSATDQKMVQMVLALMGLALTEQKARTSSVLRY